MAFFCCKPWLGSWFQPILAKIFSHIRWGKSFPILMTIFLDWVAQTPTRWWGKSQETTIFGSLFFWPIRPRIGGMGILKAARLPLLDGKDDNVLVFQGQTFLFGNFCDDLTVCCYRIQKNDDISEHPCRVSDGDVWKIIQTVNLMAAAMNPNLFWPDSADGFLAPNFWLHDVFFFFCVEKTHPKWKKNRGNYPSTETKLDINPKMLRRFCPCKSNSKWCD